jgi:hypothetical protein
MELGGEDRDSPVGESAVGKVAQVVARIRGSAGPGEICVLVSGTYETYLAYSDVVLERGVEALVISPRGSGSFVVVPWPDTTSLDSSLSTVIMPGPDAEGVAGTNER